MPKLPRTIFLYAHTIRYLRASQVLWRIWYRMRCAPRCTETALNVRTTDSVPIRWVTRKKCMIGPHRFKFLNVEGDIGEQGNWNIDASDKLWIYNLHYFDDLNGFDSQSRRFWHEKLLARWVKENPPSDGVGWEPYPLSLRIVNWIKWAVSGGDMSETLRQSLTVQVRYLVKQMEFHVLANHLFANAKALLFAGLYFEGDEAEEWLKKGVGLIKRETAEQILGDGGHYERSPMYHAIVVEDILDIANLVNYYGLRDLAALREQLLKHAENMCAWLSAMTHPDGRISFFNDAAFGIAAETSELVRYAIQSGCRQLPGSKLNYLHLNDSGYLRVQLGCMVSLIDIAEIGPSYQPGHGHADTLSFELSLGQQRIFVNSGTSCYGLSHERLRQRGTAAHNTVIIDGKDSSEVWSGFRVARRAFPRLLSFEACPSEINIRASHDGYRWLSGKPHHQRHWKFSENDISVEDTVSGLFESAEARYLLHPDVAPSVVELENGGFINLDDGRRLEWKVDCGQLRIDPATYHPEFGVSIPTRCLALRLHRGSARIQFIWS